MSRSRLWFATLYNANTRPTSLPSGMDYLVFQLEVCPDTTRLHHQAFARFTSVKSMEQVVSRLQALFECAPPHVEVVRNVAATIKYCKKDETRSDDPDAGPHEFGLPPAQGTRSDLIELKHSLDNPESTLKEVADEHFRLSLDIIVASPPTSPSNGRGRGKLKPRRLYIGDLQVQGKRVRLQSKPETPTGSPTRPRSEPRSISTDTTPKSPLFSTTFAANFAAKPSCASSTVTPYHYQYVGELCRLCQEPCTLHQMSMLTSGTLERVSEAWNEDLNLPWDPWSISETRRFLRRSPGRNLPCTRN